MRGALNSIVSTCLRGALLGIGAQIPKGEEPGAPWGYSEGFISEEMCRKHLPEPGPDVSVFLCGPPPMLEFACMPNLKKLGFDMDRVTAF